jgi:hypothetical protein
MGGPVGQAFEGESDSDTPLHKAPSPMKVVASAGLVGFNVAQDLLTLDFSTPEEAPEEFRAMPFNSQKSVEVKPGLSGVPLAIMCLLVGHCCPLVVQEGIQPLPWDVLSLCCPSHHVVLYCRD